MMDNQFKNYFSHDSSSYRHFRPNYPDALFSYLASISPSTKHAWDCATGTGQAASKLANYFRTVTATDASKEQIAQSISKKGVNYRVAVAEASGLADTSVDLITVSQALHWFDTEKFECEAKRVLKANGVLAVWTYSLFSINPEIDTEISFLYENLLGEYWPPERKDVETGYRDLRFAMHEVNNLPEFIMVADWNVDHLIGFLGSWSAVKCYQDAKSHDQLNLIYAKIAKAWGESSERKRIQWPFKLRVWRK